ncbi:MAG: hypothetical protein JRH06_03605 [Deltaproteobacteria bacterium]|nr:hypothetical protein [Deltaproteobacteria bacterium]
MASKSRKERRARKRKEIRKRQRAKKQSLPSLLRKHPSLREALNHNYPLFSCLINEDWEEGRIASVFVIREAPTGLVLSCFVVDLAGVGLKDVWGNYGLTRLDVEEIKSRAAQGGTPLIPCELSLASTIIYGGIAWAKKWRFKLPREHKIWLRVLEPVNESGVDLELFGEDGKPFLILDEEEQVVFAEERFDRQILKADLDAGRDGLSKEALIRIGDIKAALIAFSQRPEFREDFEEALAKRFGKPERPDSDHEWVTFQDWFVLEYELEKGETVATRFVEYYSDFMSDDVRRLVLGWGSPIEGLFEVKGRKNNGFLMKNLVNEREYYVFPTASMTSFDVKAGDFLSARIVPAKGFHIFSGSTNIIESDGSEAQRAKIYETAIDIQMRYPAQAFKDNEEKLKKSRESVRRQYEDFVNCFGSDEVFGTGREILNEYQRFLDYVIFRKKDPETGLPIATAYEKKTGRPYRPITVGLPEAVLNSQDVGMLCDPVEGISFLIQYRHFIDVFQHPERHIGKEETKDLVLDYLESDSISDVPFRRVAKKFPGNFSRVIAYYGDQEGFFSRNIEDLMMEFKPNSFDKLPGMVSVLDSEMARLARSAKEEAMSLVSRFKNLFKR